MCKGMAMKRTWWVVVAALGMAVSARAQEDDDGLGRRLRLGLVGGVMFEAPEAFSESSCDPAGQSYFFGARVGYVMAEFLDLEGSVTVHNDSGEVCIAEPQAPPENGTRTLRVFDEGVEGYPYVTDEVRAILHMPESRGRIASARLVTGIGYIWKKEIAFALAGLGVRYGGQRFQGTMDLERWWLGVPFTDIRQTFSDGEVISSTRDEDEVAENPILLRLGAEWRH